MELRETIISEYGSLAAFGKASGWSSRKVSSIANGKQEPTALDLELIADKLALTEDQFRDLIFNSRNSHKNSHGN